MSQDFLGQSSQKKKKKKGQSSQPWFGLWLDFGSRAVGSLITDNQILQHTITSLCYRELTLIFCDILVIIFIHFERDLEKENAQQKVFTTNNSIYTNKLR